MTETLKYYSYDHKLVKRLSNEIVTSDSITSLAAFLKTQSFPSQPSDVTQVKRGLELIDASKSMGLEIAGLRTEPERWAVPAAVQFMTRSAGETMLALVELTRQDLVAQPYEAPWFFLAGCSKLYFDALFGEMAAFAQINLPYDGPHIVANMVGGVNPDGRAFNLPLDPEDVKTIAGDLDEFDVEAFLKSSDTAEWMDMFESTRSGPHDAKTVFFDDFYQISDAFKSASVAGHGLQIVYN